MKIEISGSTDCGKKRQRNEDYLSFDEKLRIGIVADGMGGLESGEIASYLAVKEILSHLAANKEVYDPSKALMTAFPVAHNSINNYKNRHSIKRMGTTIDCLIF